MNEIRILMEKILGLYEGRGVAARTKGDTYINDKRHVLKFERVIFVPPDMDGVDTPELVNMVNDWKMTNSDVAIKDVNEVKNSTAAVIVVFKDDETNNQTAFVKYLKKFPTNKLASWGNDDFKKVTGYEYTSKLTKKEKSGIKASDILATAVGGDGEKKVITMTADEFIKTVRDNVRASSKITDDVKTDILNLIDNFDMGSEQLVKLMNESMAPAYEDYLGEILAPYAIVKGKKTSGDVQTSEAKLLAPFGYKYSDLSIRMNTVATEQLVDSTLISVDEKAKVGLSSKAESDGGAAASITTLYRALNETDEEWKTKNPYATDIINSIVKTKAVFNPLELARISGLVTPDEYPVYKDYINKQSKTSTEIPIPEVPSANVFLNSIKVKSSSPSKKFFILLAGMAKMSAAAINRDAKFNITESFLELLNRSSILQVYTKVKVNKHGMRFVGFEVKYPPQFRGKVEIWTSTRFKTTGISGKAGFKLI
jgi:hypothetical protein